MGVYFFSVILCGFFVNLCDTAPEGYFTKLHGGSRRYAEILSHLLEKIFYVTTNAPLLIVTVGPVIMMLAPLPFWI